MSREAASKPRGTASTRWRRLAIFALTCIGASGCDLGTKSIAESKLSDGAFVLLDPWLEFSLSYNRGTAFSFIRDLGDMRLIFAALSLLVVGYMIYSVARGHVDRFDAVIMGLISGGAIGNGFERAFNVLPDGGTGVVDFIKFNYPAWMPLEGSWPSFNVADMLLVCGAIFLVIRRVWTLRSKPEPIPDPSPT